MKRILVFDRGNNSLKAALFISGAIAERWNCSPGHDQDVIDGIIEESVPDAVAFSSVVPGWDRSLFSCSRRSGCDDILKVGIESELPFRVLTDEGSSIGTDRICAAAGVVEEGSSEAVIIDAGTAVTVDLLSREGFKGGAIFPGLALLLSSLHTGTAALPLLSTGGDFSPPPGKSTTGAIMAGVHFGFIGAVKELVARTIASHGGDIDIFLTGGSAGLLKEYLPAETREAPDLVLKGLHLIYLSTRER
ncbi:MAG: type III pantothenate kinase [Candidatus Krumholzibacteriota bacterium]|nr:type III pantothenate kinase [Candidatus Krumholzibacteriota bacterium]